MVNHVYSKIRIILANTEYIYMGLMIPADGLTAAMISQFGQHLWKTRQIGAMMGLPFNLLLMVWQTSFLHLMS